MAIGKASDFTIQQEEFIGGYIETLTQVTDVFNAASNGAIQLVTDIHKGDYFKEEFFTLIASLVTRRDTTSTSSATDLALAGDELIGVKLNRKIGPVANTLDSMRKIGKNMSTFSFVVGQQAAKAVAAAKVNAAIMALNAAISGETNLNYDYSATGTPTHGVLATTLGKMGDAHNRVVCWVMHSKSYFDLIGQAISDKITNVADVTINTGSVATLGKPVIVTDDASLVNTTPDPDQYHILGLVNGAAIVKESEVAVVENQIVTGLENLVVRTQGEFAITLLLKGFEWDIANGGANPNDTALALATNWDTVVTSDKDKPGCRLVAQ